MRRQCAPGQPREVKRGALTGPRVRQWKRRRGACFPFWFDSMVAIIAKSARLNRARATRTLVPHDLPEEVIQIGRFGSPRLRQGSLDGRA